MDRAEHDLVANTLRALAIDATNAADSGHPGAPLGLADVAAVLFSRVLRFDPTRPDWPNRDRFVLSNGHASMLLYGLLHLAGYELPLEELRRFRQLGSKTPGHPEYGLTPGVETTTGPLGQGFGNAVGFALAARMLKARFNDADFRAFDHHVFAVCGDGCLMEGVSAEAASLAGHLGLGELVVVYDDNGITIDGPTKITFSEDVEARFRAYGWHTLKIDGHDPEQIFEALEAGKRETERPTLILARTHIGFGSPNRQDTSKAHGEPLGEEEGALTKRALGWSKGAFEVPDEARRVFAAAAAAGRSARERWEQALAARSAASPAFAERYAAHFHPPKDLDGIERRVLAEVGAATTATRNLSGKAINALAKEVPALVGGSADLAASTKNEIKGGGAVGREAFAGRNLAFGVREHGMGAVVNGLALAGGFVPFGATFLTFSDYMRPALRLAALMKIRALTIFTHDSIYLGEDGPTHQAVEQLWALRVIPGLWVWRPADGLETAMAWSAAVLRGEPRPHVLVFTRQSVPTIARAPGFDPRLVQRGGYVVSDPPGARFVVVATGSEVHVAEAALARLATEGLVGRLVSMPCLEAFLAEPEEYRRSVLGAGLPRVSFELGRSEPWRMVVGLEGLAIGFDRFGESAPEKALAEHFGLDAEGVAAKIRGWWAQRSS